MKNFLIVLLKFCIVLLIVNIVLYAFVTRKIYFNEYRHNEDRIATSQAIILGDSHAWRLTKGLPKNAEKLFNTKIHNLAHGSDSYSDIYCKLKWALSINPKIKRIYLTKDEHMLFKPTSNKPRIIEYATKKEFQEVYKSSIQFNYYRIAKYFPMIYPSYQKLIKKYITSTISFGDTSQKLEWRELNDNERNNKLIYRFNSFFGLNEIKPSNRSLVALDKIISLCIKNNVEIIWLKLPIDNKLKELYHTKGIFSKSDVLYSKYEYKTLDYSSYPYNVIDNLSDQDHVNSKGAELILNDILKH